MATKISFQWLKPEKKIIDETLGGEKIQLFFANQARTLMAPYVPEQTGSGAHMVENVRVYVENGIGIVHYLAPYARYQFGGKLMVSSITGSSWSRGEAKVLTNKNLSYTKLLASSHWDKTMKTARGDDLAKAVQNYIKGGAK